MALHVKVQETVNYEPTPAGNHVARLYSIVHIGTSEEETPYGLKMQNKVRLTFELLNETKVFKEGEEAKPHSISRIFNISWHEKASLRKFIKGMLGKDSKEFDIETLINHTCLLNVTHNEKGEKVYSNIDSASPIPKGMEVPKAVNPAFIMNYTDQWDDMKFEILPQFLQDMMKKTEEYRAKVGEDKGIDDKDIPF